MRVLFRESYGNEKETIYIKSEGKIFPQYLLSLSKTFKKITFVYRLILY